ncbi:hypothetical protein STEG23_011573 [Scotinomys teguina]
MTICQFFLQGRCRFGDRCWNEHPGTRGAGVTRQPPPQQQPSSGSSRHSWNANSQRHSSVIQPSSFSKSTPWGGSRDQDKQLFGSFDSGASTSRGFGSSQNPFAALVSDEQKDEKKLLEGIVKDVEIWESSGQWMFSVYSPVKKKPNISGFTDISPEELRLEYHNFLTSNNLQSYLNSVQQLVSQWRNRINELKNLNMSTKGALCQLNGKKRGKDAPLAGISPETPLSFFPSFCLAAPPNFLPSYQPMKMKRKGKKEEGIEEERRMKEKRERRKMKRKKEEREKKDGGEEEEEEEE